MYPKQKPLKTMICFYLKMGSIFKKSFEEQKVQFRNQNFSIKKGSLKSILISKV